MSRDGATLSTVELNAKRPQLGSRLMALYDTGNKPVRTVVLLELISEPLELRAVGDRRPILKIDSWLDV
ncbi:hypothetical protein C443_00372 [Haloarcula argentinensis DSM 12282]|uniref:Uncharacterized protein n=1 Tax=Haloarcula argentinensis TaxID=43776 RepID=A0A830FX76_HALAR|nr:hypothetical protein C443_00372 [Haloarcula argentinensis DSM 12282]MDS0255869.1 hypothetical protein [Haloarcula argentinensis]GGM49686.1 hypothetical protein GCM10009006_33650 [Haloarcula argentinensis]